MLLRLLWLQCQAFSGFNDKAFSRERDCKRDYNALASQLLKRSSDDIQLRRSSHSAARKTGRQASDLRCSSSHVREPELRLYISARRHQQ